MHFSTIFPILATVAPLAMADCCYANALGYCDDGTGGTPYCGYGQCNTFGCNCQGGCRHPSHRRRGQETDYAKTVDAFKAANLDGSGGLTLNQLTQWAGVPDDDPEFTKLFKEHDKNGDGVLTLDEILT